MTTARTAPGEMRSPGDSSPARPPAMKRFLQRCLTLAVIVHMAVITPRAQAPITLRIDPKVQMVSYGGTGVVRVKITIPKHALNRAVCVAIDGPMFRSSCFEHVGLGAASQAEWTFRDLDVGEYEAEARLERAKEGESGRDYSISRDRFVISGMSGF